MKYFNMVHCRPVQNYDDWVIFEEEDWFRTDVKQLEDLIESYAGMNFYYGLTEAIDGTPMVVMYNPEAGWRVIQTRN